MHVFQKLFRSYYNVAYIRKSSRIIRTEYTVDIARNQMYNTYLADLDTRCTLRGFDSRFGLRNRDSTIPLNCTRSMETGAKRSSMTKELLSNKERRETWIRLTISKQPVFLFRFEEKIHDRSLPRSLFPRNFPRVRDSAPSTGYRRHEQGTNVASIRLLRARRANAGSARG